MKTLLAAALALAIATPLCADDFSSGPLQNGHSLEWGDRTTGIKGNASTQKVDTIINNTTVLSVTASGVTVTGAIAGATIPGSLINNSTIDSTKLGKNSVDSEKLAANSVDTDKVQSGVINTSKLLGGSGMVQSGKLVCILNGGGFGTCRSYISGASICSCGE